jgi:hypothetical protein
VNNSTNLPEAHAERIDPPVVEAYVVSSDEPSAPPAVEFAPKPKPMPLQSRALDPYDLVGQAFSKFTRMDADLAYVIQGSSKYIRPTWDAFLAADTQQARRDLSNEQASDTLDLRANVSGVEEVYQDQQRKSQSPRPSSPGSARKISRQDS